MSNRLPFAALAVVCIAAAGAGGYLATRQNTVPMPAAAQGTASATPAVTAVPAASPAPSPAVQETGAPVGETAPKAVPESAVAPPSSDVAKTTKRRSEAGGPRNARQMSSVARNEQIPAPPNTWPASQVPAAPQGPALQAEPQARPDDRVAQEPVRPLEPPKPTFEELVIPRDSVIGLATENRIASDTAHVEDRVDARVTRDVRVGSRVAIPSGSRVIGSVTQVDRGGKFKEQARLGIRFHTIVLADGTRLPISTETIVRLGEAPANGSAAKIGGGTVGGAILGAILGGAKGAAIGATAGAGAGTAAVTAGDRSTVVLAPGTQLTPRMLSPVTVTVEQQ